MQRTLLLSLIIVGTIVHGKVAVFEGTGDGCSTLLYTEVFSVELSNDKTVDLTDVAAETSSCSVTDNDGRAMEISFGDLDSMKGFKVELTFSKTATGYWKSDEMSVSYNDSSAQTLTGMFKHVPLLGLLFSHGCSLKAVTPVSGAKKLRPEDDEPETGTVTLNMYQIQVYNLKDSKFSTEVQCVNWISPGAWMGIFGGLLTISVLIMSVMMLLNTATPDRFETTKSKCLMIPHEH